MKFEVRNGTCGYGKNTVLKAVSLTVEAGEVLCILGQGRRLFLNQFWDS